MHLYDFTGYCSMLTDSKRLDGYVRALKKVVTDDSVVLDLGAGTGIFSILATEYGAKKVYAVEYNNLINLLKEVIDKRGFESKIKIFHNISTEIEFEQKANVLIFDLHGGFPLIDSSIETIIDARERLLTKDAVFIPKKENIYFAVSQSDKIYKDKVSNFLQEFYGFRIPSGNRLVCNRFFSAKSKKEKLLSEPETFAEIDYRTIDQTSFENNLEWEIKEDGTAQGLRGWFENELSDGIGLSNSIEVEKTTYSSPFFPFENEVKVKKGDIVRSYISAKYENSDYIWSWKTEIFEQGDFTKLKANFNQSQFASMYLDPKTSLKKSEYFVPEPNETAEIDLFTLTQMNGESMQGDIADALIEKFPDKFKTFEEALEYAFVISQKYSK